MDLRIQIDKKFKSAFKSKNTLETITLKLIRSAIKYKDIELRSGGNTEPINDQQILSILQNLVKQRKDSIESFKLASREDLIAKEKYEIEVINQFLPKQLDDKDIEEIIKNAIKEHNFSSLKDMGNLMNNLKTYHTGSVDMGKAGKIAKLLLNN